MMQTVNIKVTSQIIYFMTQKQFEIARVNKIRLNVKRLVPVTKIRSLIINTRKTL